MGSDACFRIGHSHSICQDYAIAGAHHHGGPYAILSDGCSGEVDKHEPGSPFTDFGARFLVRAARISLTRGDSMDAREIIYRASEMAYGSRLPRTALDATLLAAILRGDRVVVYQAGDGVVAARRRDTKEIVFTSVKFGSNMPFYPSYLLPGASLAYYLGMAKSATYTYGRRLDSGEWTESHSELSLSHTSECMGNFVFETSAYDLVLIMSDGAESFTDAKGQPVPLTAVLEQLFDIKGFEGEFISRRCNGFLRRFCVANGWKHHDDLSVAGIYVAEPAIES